jgi:hypothetical protein
MNWHAETTTPLHAGELPDAIDDLDVADATPEAEEQLDAAKDAAKAIVAAGALGDSSDDEAVYGAELTGHANPGHDGDTPDQVTVRVRRIPTPQPVEADAEAEEVAEPVA